MLNKRFKLAKCKTSLKLATSRIKLMRNKKGIQMNQMKKELAQLLESGQDRTARIRVEHVIREEKMLSAYDLVEIYCELIAARLPIIESQKTCPIDLKEAITSVIFAAPRCSDIPELVDVRKQFTAKYGKEFVSGAIELRPDCGVSRMLAEKLSAIAPDVQTKMKVLSAVAKEYNVNWDPTSFEEKESKPPNDLLNGPVNFEKISTINVEPPKIQTSNVQNVHSHDEKPTVPLNFSEQNKRYTLDTQKSSASTNEDTRPAGTPSENMDMRQSFNSSRNDSFPSRENWNMEFKDATSAAQAAAESAERASMAARAAAHLSSQITRQHSTESHDSHIRHKNPQGSSTSEFKDSYNRSFNDRNPELRTQKMNPEATGSFSRPVSLRPRNDSIEGSSVNNFHQSDGYFENSLNDDLDVLTSDQKKVSEKNQGNVFSKSAKTSSYGDARKNDETDSDDEVKSKFSSSENTHFSTPLRNTTHQPGSPKPVDPSVIFDLSDGPDSESEKETATKMTSPRKQDLKKPPIELYDLIESGSSVSTPEDDDKNPQSRHSSQISDDLETENELKFGTLTGGFRNKGGFKLPPYTKTAATKSSHSAIKSSHSATQSSHSANKLVQEIPTKTDQSSFNSRTSRSNNKKPNASISSSESDSDDYIDKFAVQSSKTRSQFAPPDAFFGDDSEEEASPVPKPASASRIHLGSGLSRRTKGYVEPTESYIENSKKDSAQKSSEKSGKESERKSSKLSYSNKQEAFEKMPELKVSEQPLNPRRKIVESAKTEASKSSNPSSETSVEANNVKKPSHVHPKLPEYDSLAARIQAIRMNHQ